MTGSSDADNASLLDIVHVRNKNPQVFNKLWTLCMSTTGLLDQKVNRICNSNRCWSPAVVCMGQLLCNHLDAYRPDCVNFRVLQQVHVHGNVSSKMICGMHRHQMMCAVYAALSNKSSSSNLAGLFVAAVSAALSGEQGRHQT